MLKVTLFFLLPLICFSQIKTLRGTISSEAGVLLESANIIAKPLQDKASLKFAITDNKGRYLLELDKNIDYEIVASYIGFKDELLVLNSNSDMTLYNFKLHSSGEKLKEIVIKREYKPIEIKKDTITFNVKSFANGNERKMKEILEKLPGVEVDKNGIVTVQGKRVTQMLVEGKAFFGGGSKLAVENIPADALDKIEVIDNFNEVGFMKKVSDSEDLAMNVKLKEEKKKFVFGDIEAGLGIGVDKSYLLHSGLFYYTPKLNISFIGDLNNIGKSTFTYSDLRRFTGGTSNYIMKKKVSNDLLYALTKDNVDVVENKSQFEALNVSYNFSSKFNISVFSVFSKVLTETKNVIQNEYLENNDHTFENKAEINNNINNLNITNLKLDYTPNKNQKWLYNVQFQLGTNNLKGILNSSTITNSNVFKTISDTDNKSFKQYLEWHKNYSTSHIQTLAINQSYEDTKSQNQWLTNKPFLVGVLPFEKDTIYNIEQLKQLKANTVDAVFKHYWIINSHNHLYLNIGNTFENSNFETSEKQLLSDNTINDFISAGFGNRTRYQFVDVYGGLEYKFKIGKWTNKAGLYYHWYNSKTEQLDGNYSFLRKIALPQWNSEFEFNQSEKITFNYKLETNFPEVSSLSDGFTLQKYNLVYKGNALLENGKFHSFNVFYNKMNIYKGLWLNVFSSYTKRTEIIRNEVIVDDINQYNSPFLGNNPETSALLNGSIAKKIYRFELKLNANLTWLSYYQKLNNIITLNERNAQNLAFSFKTIYKEWPNFNFKYERFNQFNGLTNSDYKSDIFSGDFEITVFKFWTYKLNYQNLKNSNSNGRNNFYEITNTSLRYQRKNSPFGFELIANNLFDVRRKNSYSFSDYIISQQSTYVLPRVLMFSMNYKL
ncbi:TonB-dependent receptor [Flavobacterium tistrianum]|uniref:TonB-dependent receptor n=1 Tax=Flavobacterium tistrianum TaxID=1685414 RepID=UPI001EF6F620|nr:TonB-dependent receptor [Flavobacterium tistrianum]